mgnify:CR=1 FL=1
MFPQTGCEVASDTNLAGKRLECVRGGGKVGKFHEQKYPKSTLLADNKLELSKNKINKARPVG